jgi:hypothetical protein
MDMVFICVSKCRTNERRARMAFFGRRFCQELGLPLALKEMTPEFTCDIRVPGERVASGKVPSVITPEVYHPTIKEGCKSRHHV